MLELCEALGTFGLVPLVEDSDGRGGLHIWVLFADAVAAPRLYAFAAAVIAELKIDAEIFPKQPRLQPGKLGNFLRLPGRHHSRAHWSRFLADGVWHDGEDAVELLLSAWTSPPDQLPTLAVITSQDPTARAGPTRAYAHDSADRHIRRYMSKLPTGLGVGEGRNIAAYRLACVLVEDYGLTDARARAWLDDWNALQRTPLDGAETERVIANARAYGKAHVGRDAPWPT